MNRLRNASLLLLLPILYGCSSAEVCDEQLTWVPGSPKVDIPANDRLLICGDPSYPAWTKIPPGQSATFLRSYLESKAYLEPTITVDYDAKKVVVNAGNRAVITALDSTGDVPPEWSIDPLKTYLDSTLEKSNLDSLTNYSIELLKSLGYGCATVTLTAHVDGRVILHLKAGKRQIFPETRDLNSKEVDSEILARYEPFHPGDAFDIRKTLLAGRRMESDSVASSSQYIPTCEKGELVAIDRSASFGPRRTWEIGIGASTEEYPLSFIRWKNNRLWSSASNLQLELFGSNVRQKLSGELKWFTMRADRRFYLRPGAQIEHRVEKQYETIETKATLVAGRTFDTGDWTLEPEAGFSTRKLRILKTLVNRTDTFLTPGLSLGAHTHDFELYRGSPRTGSDFDLIYEYIPGGQVKSIAVHRLVLQGTTLWNYRGYVEPRWVIGMRFGFGSLYTTNDSTPDVSRIPPDWFFLVGGDRDLRGFGRNSLPNEDQGAASAATTGIESRWPNLFSFPIEPLVFFDFGWLGNGNWRFDTPVYLSPGFGVRSATPLGTIRATFAKGYVPMNHIQRGQFFVSFGTEF